MKQVKVIGLCLVALFAMNAVAATSASAKRVWTFKGAELPAGVEKQVKVTKINAAPVLTSELAGQEVDIECEIISLKHYNASKVLEANGIIFNEAKTPTNVGRDKGVVAFEKCKISGLASLICKLTAANAKEILSPPVSEGMTSLVENTAKTVVWDDFLPEGKATGETEGVFANIHFEGSSCPTTEELVKSTLTIGALNAAKEGEGGVAANIEPQGEAALHKFIFPCTANTSAINWLGNTIAIGSFKDVLMNPEKMEGAAAFCSKGKVALEVSVELTTGENWGVK
jgi:hypothetical protein